MSRTLTPEPRGGVPVDGDPQLEPRRLLVGGHVGQLGKLRPVEDLGAQVFSSVSSGSWSVYWYWVGAAGRRPARLVSPWR